MSEELRLIKKARKGNIDAFEKLISLYEKKIYNYCYRMTNNREDAEDLTQEIFLKVYRSMNSFKGNSKFSTWIYRIAYNTCVDKYRKKKKVVVSLSSNDEDDRDMDLPSKDPLPEERVIHKEEYKAIQDCIASLKPEYRAVIVLRDIQNHTYDEIAQILNIPLGTVKSHISRARAALRESLEAQQAAYSMKGVE